MTIARKSAPITPNGRLSVTLILAAVIHAIMILGVSFSADLKERVSPRSLEVVLVQTASPHAPDKADYIAQFNSQASRTADTKLQPAAPVLGASPIPIAGQAPFASRAASAAQSGSLKTLLLTRGHTDRQVFNDEQHQPQETLDSQASRAQFNLEIARLTSELAAEAQRYAQRPRVKYLDAVSAKAAVEAAYIEAWIDKVESVGNLNYPDEARRRKLSGKLILHVLLDSEGEIVSALIGSPSGQQVLDDAAMRIVKLAAPFKPFSPEMRRQYDRLMITRTWIFEADSRLTPR
jgi:protein TonB